MEGIIQQCVPIHEEIFTEFCKKHKSNKIQTMVNFFDKERAPNMETNQLNATKAAEMLQNTALDILSNLSSSNSTQMQLANFIKALDEFMYSISANLSNVKTQGEFIQLQVQNLQLQLQAAEDRMESNIGHRLDRIQQSIDTVHQSVKQLQPTT